MFMALCKRVLFYSFDNILDITKDKIQKDLKLESQPFFKNKTFYVLLDLNSKIKFLSLVMESEN
jgi:hypothetical protein